MKVITGVVWLLLSGVAEAYQESQPNIEDVRSAYDEFCELTLSLSCRTEHGIPCDQLGLRQSNCIESIFWHLTIANAGPTAIAVSELDLTLHNVRTLELVLSLPVNPIPPGVTTGMSPREDVDLCTNGSYSASLIADATAGRAACSGTAVYSFSIGSTDPPPNPVPLAVPPTPVQSVPAPVPVPSPTSPEDVRPPPPETCQVACSPGFVCSPTGTFCLGIDVPVSAPMPVPIVAPTPTLAPVVAPVAVVPVQMPVPVPFAPSGRCARLWGDPHIITFDGLKYDCQADGEVTLLKSLNSTFEIQARFETCGSSVTCLARIAIRPGDESPLLEFSDPSEFLVNGVRTDFESGSGFLVTSDGGGIGILFNSGLDIQRSGLTFTICLSDDFLSDEALVGIMGTPNANPADDWMDRNGQILPIPSEAADLLFEPAYNYCTTNWCVQTSSDSLFTYQSGETFDDHSCFPSRPYNPSIENALVNPPQCLVDICEGSIECLIDGINLGRAGAVDQSVLDDALFARTCVPSSAKSCYFSCADALETSCITEGQTVRLCPLGVESNLSFDVYCDQSFDGGGWMLAYSYNHLAGEDNSLNSNSIPIDPDNGYSHILLQSLGYSVEDIESVRFFCRTSGHDRVIHFKTDALAIKSTALNGYNDDTTVSDWNDVTCKSSLFDGHNSTLPAATDSVTRSLGVLGDVGFTDFPFFTSATSHWSIGAADGGGNRFECDDFLGNSLSGLSTNTLHNVWVKVAPKSSIISSGTTVRSSCLEHLQAGEIVDGVYLVNPDGLNTFRVFCDQTTRGGGWALFAHVLDLVESPEPRVVPLTAPVTPEEPGVIVDVAWTALRDSMVDGFMFQDENGAISRVPKSVLEGANCRTPWDVSTLNLKVPDLFDIGGIDKTLFWQEDSGCVGVGLDYCIASLNRFDGAFPISSNGLYNGCVAAPFYEEWGYGSLWLGFETSASLLSFVR